MTDRHKAIWVAYLFLLLMAASHKAQENEQDAQRCIAWSERVDQLTRRGLIERRRINALVSTARRADNPRTLLQEALNDGRPFDETPAGDYDEAVWMDPTYGIRVNLTFSNDRLVASGMNWSSGDVQQLHPRPDRPSRLNAVEWIRSFTASVAPKLWMGLFAIALLSPWRRVLFAEVSLALALLCGAAWLVSPYYEPTLQGVLSNDSLVFAVVMIGASLTLLACRTSGLDLAAAELGMQYGLKSLLMVTALAALAMATRPVGVVAALTFMVGGTYFFALSRIVNRRFPELD